MARVRSEDLTQTLADRPTQRARAMAPVQDQAQARPASTQQQDGRPGNAIPPNLYQEMPAWLRFAPPTTWGQVPGYLAGQFVQGYGGWIDQRYRNSRPPTLPPAQSYFGAAGQDVYNQQMQRYQGLYPNQGQGGSNLVRPLVPPSVTMPDTRAGQVQRAAPTYNAYVPPEVAQYQQQDRRNILPAGAQDHTLSQFARDSAGAFRLNPYASGQINPYAGVFDANSMFWDPFAQSPGGPRTWPTLDAAVPLATGGGGYGGWGWGGGGGGGGGGYAPEWYDRAARWAWGKEA